MRRSRSEYRKTVIPGFSGLGSRKDSLPSSEMEHISAGAGFEGKMTCSLVDTLSLRRCRM